ncbi:tRNA pseudouridine(38-40) synthase TruA [Patiriisocius hiemis]|uniref:tRNA pseudouridine synthase A n=1 Tax=Patiriisocius hiemis TaxID=3075604 RepID=A0ABU2YCL1_9FLAO|nr:tRNA pseudouridine(38-40) synthase TruA [Constantimarinum sp. W242]MDT0555906.1 tRNA pseudouridine(38-40) synthase TruA [Constantimarinum sp. W242]
MRYFVELSYNGKNYYGWQIQPDVISVQEVLEIKLSTFFRDQIKIVGAGRTDAGVHAKQMYAHFDFEGEVDLTPKTIFKLNSFLPKDISVYKLHSVPKDAHARFDATERGYEYDISLQKNPFLEGLMHELHLIPDVDLMNKAALMLLGNKDFQCFSKSHTDVKTYYCNVKEAVWEQKGDFLKFKISADRFLRNMVRAIVGTLLDVGYGKVAVEDIPSLIESKDRTKAGASAPAHGLYLTKVLYPKNIL